MSEILLTGGTGYIATHTAISLIEAGYKVVAVDNLVNSDKQILDKVAQITGQQVELYIGDVGDEQLMNRIFSEHEIETVIHFAGLKAVGESVSKPLQYYQNNLDATIVLLKTMLANNVNNLVFSSSATVYDCTNPPERVEGMKLGCTSPYGWTKFMSEQIIRDTAAVNKQFNAINLRYFNPVGAHKSGLIGELPNGIPNNLLPYIQQVATGKLDYLRVYGDDYNTPDGTGVRDYVHVCDLADAHTAAVKYLEGKQGVCEEINVGTGKGTSVLEIVKAFESATGVTIPYRIVGRRPGDVDEYYANSEKAQKLLGWKSKYTIEDMCADAYRWQKYLESSQK